MKMKKLYPTHSMCQHCYCGTSEKGEALQPLKMCCKCQNKSRFGAALW